MYPFIESIKVENRQFFNLKYHNSRLNSTRFLALGFQDKINITDFLKIPEYIDNKRYKCRILYSERVENVEFELYEKREISRLKVVYDDTLDYTFKTSDRKMLNQLFAQKGDADDIIIVKNGLVTDSFAANLVFSDGQNFFTPRQPLLKGTCRARLINEGKIKEIDIRVDDLINFREIYLINALLDFGECTVKSGNVHF